MQDNDVRGLAPKLSEISTQMNAILDQQKELLDLRSKVEKSETITEGLGDKLDLYNNEIEDLWEAFDEAVKNPLK
jgi:predicted methyltransferase